jgi:hypothetical protein
MRKKKIYLNRVAITLIGNPTHLGFRYDEQDGVLYFTPALSDDLDAYEIPHFYWTNLRKTCEIARIAFLRALQYRLGWEEDSKYYYDVRIIKINDAPTLVYSLLEGKRVR